MNTRALTHYQALAAEAAAYRHKQDRAAIAAVDDLMARIRQPEPCNFCATDAAPKPVSRWLFWTFVCGFSMVMTFASWELVRVLPVLRGWLP